MMFKAPSDCVYLQGPHKIQLGLRPLHQPCSTVPTQTNQRMSEMEVIF